MDYVRKPKPTAQELQADPDLMAVCRWKEPQLDEPKADSAAGVAFAKKHRPGFFRLAGRALGLLG
ncbi:MAG: hypothetical protein JWM39_67 [Parcubacteria group bacterium]|nr:hypothetical protein [Parcubacteria group bacterium]